MLHWPFWAFCASMMLNHGSPGESSRVVPAVHCREAGLEAVKPQYPQWYPQSSTAWGPFKDSLKAHYSCVHVILMVLVADVVGFFRWVMCIILTICIDHVYSYGSKYKVWIRHRGPHRYPDPHPDCCLWTTLEPYLWAIAIYLFICIDVMSCFSLFIWAQCQHHKTFSDYFLFD